MLRRAIGSTLISDGRRSIPSNIHSRVLSRTFVASTKQFNPMAQPAQEPMNETLSTPKLNGDGTKTSEEQKELPKLSKQEFRAYNQMAEHMNYFVMPSNDIDRHAY